MMAEYLSSVTVIPGVGGVNYEGVEPDILKPLVSQLRFGEGKSYWLTTPMYST